MTIDEVFIDVTDYLESYRTTAHELALRMVREVLKETGITATAGIGTNMYLCMQNIDDYNMSLVLKTGETVFLKSIFDRFLVVNNTKKNQKPIIDKWI